MIHASFAALQATCLGLLAATRSWHFMLLNGACVCIWGATVWVANEVALVRRIEAEADRLRRLREKHELGVAARL